MDKVVHALYEEWFEPLYLESGMVNSLERYFWLFERIRSSLKEIHFTYDDEQVTYDALQF